ncbi:hypothetical protein AAHN97_28350 [Chitinophaga niabensis]|uniref:hypothetical protein n=1 Tax=Chitinophaga niabensis TaxID=536979 RepID=UPI0031BB3D9E
MNPYERIIKALEQEELHPEVKEDKSIKWQNKHGNQCRIFEQDMTVEEERLAWFESDGWAHHLLRVMENGEFFNWTPETYNPVFGCFCLLLEWYNDHLIFIYQEKHKIYICSIHNQQVKHFSFSGEEIERKGNLISFAAHGDLLKNKVSIIQIPELILQEPISETTAEQMGLLPQGLNRPDGFLKAK